MYENGAFCWLESISLPTRKLIQDSRERQHLKWNLGGASMRCRLSHFTARGGNKECASQGGRGLWPRSVRRHVVLLGESKPSPLCWGSSLGSDGCFMHRAGSGRPVLWLCCSWTPRWLAGGAGPRLLFQCLQSSDIRFDRLLVSSERQTLCSC